MSHGSVMIRKLFFAILIILYQQIAFASSKYIKIAVVFSEIDQPEYTTQRIIDGIYTAKLLFEKQHDNYHIDLIHYRFHKHDLSSVANVANQICEDKIPIVIGGEMSGDALILGQVLSSCHVILVTPTATNPKVNENMPYVFRISASDEDVAHKMANFIFNKFPESIIGVMDDVSLPYSDFLSSMFIKYFSSKSIKPLIVQKVLRENIDYSHEIDEFIKNKVQVVIMLTYDTDFKRFLYQAAEKHYFPVYIGSDGWGSNEAIINMIHNYPVYHNKFVGYRNNYWVENQLSDLKIQFKNVYQANFHTKPNEFNAIGFDSGWVVLNAIQKHPSNINPDLMKCDLENLHLKLLTTNNFLFKKDHFPDKNLYVYKLTVNGAQYITTIKGNN